MPRIAIRATLCATIAVLACTMPADSVVPARFRRPPGVQVSLEFRAAPNAAAVVVYQYARSFTIDPRRITFTAETGTGAPVPAARVVAEGVSPARVDPQPHVYSGAALPGTQFVNFHLAAAGLHAGMYRVAPIYSNPIGHYADGTPLNVERVDAANIAFSVPPAPDSPPARTVGAEYEFDADAPQVAGPVIARIARVTGIGSSRRYELDTESQWPDRVAHLTLGDADFTAPTIHAVVTDAGQRRARASYEGHDVWGFGRFEVACGPTPYEVPPLTPLRVRRIVRVLGISPTLHVGEQAVGILGAGFAFTSAAPLVVFFDSPRETQFLGSRTPTPCTYWRMLGDDWQLDVTYSPLPPQRTHPDWSAATLADIAAGRIRTGMTHAMVAWAAGFPDAYGTRDDLLRRQTWVYEAPPPSGSVVEFRGDRVVRYDPPGMLP